MNTLVTSQDFTESQNKLGLLRRLLRALVTIWSSPRGEGDWEARARGL